MSHPALRTGLIADICAAACAQGWTVERTRKSHIRLVPADRSQSIVVSSGTPSDHRAAKNFLSQARRSGLVYPPEGK